MKSKVVITIETGNAAFEYAPGNEVARILRKYADSIDGGEPEGVVLHDINGNRVGKAEVWE